MRTLILLDEDADRKKVEKALSEVASIFKINTGIVCEWHFEVRDFYSLRFEDYYNGNYGMNRADIAADTKKLWEAWRHEIDNVLYLVHDQAWTPGRMSNRIWGWNLAGAINGYNVQQCRYDPKNNVNNVGTIYHEIMHCQDSFVWAQLAVDINKLGFSWTNWDEDVVHGRGSEWDYIRYSENQAALKSIGTYVSMALKKRVDIYTTRTSLQQEVIRLAEKTVVLLREEIIRRGSIPVACTQRCIESLELIK